MLGLTVNDIYFDGGEVYNLIKSFIIIKMPKINLK